MIWSKRPYLSFASYSAVHHSPLPLFSSARAQNMQKKLEFFYNSASFKWIRWWQRQWEVSYSLSGWEQVSKWVGGRRQWISSKESMRFRKSASCSLEQLSKVERFSFCWNDAKNAMDKQQLCTQLLHKIHNRQEFLSIYITILTFKSVCHYLRPAHRSTRHRNLD